ncbi:MAG: IS110 family transposase [Rhizomicrobium sp.]
MEYFAGLDVSMEETAICVVDNKGNKLLEATVPTEPEAIAEELSKYAKNLKRVGHEAGALSPWLQPALVKLKLPAVCLETRHVRAAMAAQRNKTDATDALALAHIIRTGWFRQVHIKSDESYRLRLLLTQRRNLKRKLLDVENSIRHSLKAFGMRLGRLGRTEFEHRVRELVGEDRLMCAVLEPMLKVREVMWEQYGKMHKLLVQIVARDELCRRFMRIPGVGPVTALAFKTGMDDPTRFKASKVVGAYFGLTPRRWQSGTSINSQGHISKQGDNDVRRALYEAASAILTRFKGWSALKAWGMKIAKARGMKKATTAVARKLAVIMHAMWKNGSEYRWTATEAAQSWSKAKDQRLLGGLA